MNFSSYFSLQLFSCNFSRVESDQHSGKTLHVNYEIYTQETRFISRTSGYVIFRRRRRARDVGAI